MLTGRKSSRRIEKFARHLQYTYLSFYYYYCNLQHDGNSQRNCESEGKNLIMGVNIVTKNVAVHSSARWGL